MKLKVPIFGQRDSRWSGLQLDSSPYHVGDSGCTSVVSSSALGISPDVFVSKMNSTGGYTSGGLLIWAKVVAAFGGTDEARSWGLTPADLDWIKSKIQQGFPVVIETRFPGAYGDSERDNITHQHWLVVVSDDLICNDPWYADETFFQGRYGDPGRWIYSAHCFNKKIGEPAGDTMTIDKKVFADLIAKLDKQEQEISLSREQNNKLVAENDSLRNKIVDLQAQITGIANLRDRLNRINSLTIGWLTYLRSRTEIQSQSKI